MSSKTQSEFASKILASKRRLPWNLRCLYTFIRPLARLGGVACIVLT
jgi:hypothetical protein